MGATRGEPARLDVFTAAMVARSGRVAAPLEGYRSAVHRLAAAPSELTVTTPDRSPGIGRTVDELRVLDRQPRLLAAALRLADRSGFGLWPVGNLVDAWLAALRAALEQAPASAADREARGRQLGEDLAALTASDADVEAIYPELAALLSDLDPSDPFQLAGFYETITPDQFYVLLERVYDAHYLDGALFTPAHAVSDERPELQPMLDMLEPLTAAFEAAAAMDLLPAGFADRLLQRGRDAIDAYEHPGLEPLLQLFVFGDVLNTGNVEVTVGFSRLALDGMFFEYSRFLWGAMSPYRTMLDDGTVVTYQAEQQVAAAARALAGNPEAAYRFLLDGDDQALLLDRAGESWWWDGDAAGQLPSEVLEAGLLAHPLDTGMFDAARPSTAYVSALRSLVVEVGGRDGIGEPIARGLGLVLAPHYDSVRFAVDPNTLEPDVLRLDADTLQAFAANVAAHDVGLGALQQVAAGWSSEVYAGWAPRLIEAGPIVDQFDTRFFLDTGGLVEVHRLLDRGLQDAGLDFEERHKLTFWALDKASGLARSRLLKATRLTGPKGFLAGEALSWAGSHGTDWVKDQIRGAGPAGADDVRAMLRQQLPVLAVDAILFEFEQILADIDDPVERERMREQFLPVEPGARDYTFERDKSFGEQGWWERINPFDRPTTAETVEVEFADWPEEVMEQWLLENRAALPASGLNVDDAKWWLNLVVFDIWKGVEVRTRGR